MANITYRKFRLGLANALHHWDAPMDVRALLVMTNTTADTDLTPEFVGDLVTLDECDATGYARVACTSEAANEDGPNDRIELTVAQVDFGSPTADASRQVAGVVFYKHVTNDADSPIIGFYDTVGSGPSFPFTVNGGQITVTPDAEGLIQL